MRRLIVAAVLFVLVLPAPAVLADADKTYEKLDVFAQVLHYVQESYVENTDSRRLLYSAIRGMLKTLDPHTVFMTPEEFKSMQEDTSGHFGGVGIELAVRDRQLVVVAPIDGFRNWKDNTGMGFGVSVEVNPE